MMWLVRFLMVAAVVFWVGMIVCLVAIAVEAGNVPDRPLHMRLNRLNILMDRSLWTPQIAALNRASMRFGLAWLVCMLLGALAILALPAH